MSLYNYIKYLFKNRICNRNACEKQVDRKDSNQQELQSNYAARDFEALHRNFEQKEPQRLNN